MEEIDPVTGLPKSLGISDQLEKERQTIRIRVLTRKFRKKVTQVSGLESEEHAERLAKVLKKKLACGGTSKNGVIELQGDHLRKTKEVLLAECFNEDLIDDQG